MTPPDELLRKWIKKANNEAPGPFEYARVIATLATQWELEGCIDVLGEQENWDKISQSTGWKDFINKLEEILLDARQPCVKEDAIAVLDDLDSMFDLPSGHYNTLLSALTALPQ